MKTFLKENTPSDCETGLLGFDLDTELLGSSGGMEFLPIKLLSIRPATQKTEGFLDLETSGMIGFLTSSFGCTNRWWGLVLMPNGWSKSACKKNRLRDNQTIVPRLCTCSTYLWIAYWLKQSSKNAHDVFRAVSNRDFIKCHDILSKRSWKFSSFANTHLKNKIQAKIPQKSLILQHSKFLQNWKQTAECLTKNVNKQLIM